MTTTDWIIDLALIVIVLRQIREDRVNARFVLLPLGIVAYTASHYLHSLLTAGNDLLLIGGALALGTALGVAGGCTTFVRAADGHAYARAGFVAASIWVASMSARLAFIVYITHPDGGAWLTHFSIAHRISGADVWQTALVLLALSEVVVRIGIVVARAARQDRVVTERTELVSA